MLSRHLSITEAAKCVEADHGIIFMKTTDGAIHALEFGSHRPTKTAPLSMPCTDAAGEATQPAHDASQLQGSTSQATDSTLSAATAAAPVGREIAFPPTAVSSPPHARFTPQNYTVELLSPYVPRQGMHPPTSGWVSTVGRATRFSPETLDHRLRHEWFEPHVGFFVFQDAGSFVDHVWSLLTQHRADAV